MEVALPAPAHYRPWSKGVYDVSPNLKPLGTDFGNGEADRHFAQIDTDFDRYRQNRLASYRECRDKYFATESLPSHLLSHVYEVLSRRLRDDHPEFFDSDGESFASNLSGERFFYSAGKFDRGNLPEGIDHPLEALVWQIQADFALVHRTPDGRDRIVTILVTAPSHWRPQDKLGLSFFESHQVVPGFERINATAPKMVDAMISKGPFVRFVWGIDSDDRLNHHPDPPPGEDPITWKGRQFETGDLWVRYERQTLLGVPEANAGIFLIHAKTLPVSQLTPDERLTLRSAVVSMSDQALAYKGFAAGRQYLLNRLLKN
jgi:dimethylamine monooxygenase subunit A